MYWAAPCATRRTLPNVKSSAVIPRQPSVPNLICVGFNVIGLKVACLAGPLEGLEDLANVLRSRARNHKKGVIGVDDDHVTENDRGNEPVVTEDQAVYHI